MPELQQHQNLAAFELADGELADVMAAMCCGMCGRMKRRRRLRALSLFVRRVCFGIVNSRTLMYQRCAANVYQKNERPHCESLS